MSKSLVAYFSVGGTTKRLAERLAAAKEADIFAIVPQKPYEMPDLDYTNPNSRCTLEMNDEACRPEIAEAVQDMAQYDTIMLGFPIWWGREPSIIDTFLEAYDLAGKTIILFCTSAMSPIAGAYMHVQGIVNEAVTVKAGGRLIDEVKDEDMVIWPSLPLIPDEEKELVQAFHLMWDLYPEQVRLIDKKFRIVAGNKAYLAAGGLLNVPCNIGNPELHKGCKAMACLKSQETMIQTTDMNGVEWNAYWVPVNGYDEYYVHFTNGLNEFLAKAAQ